MWILISLLVAIFTLFIRQNKLLRAYFHSWLYRVGLQLGTHIYTPVCDIHSEFRYFDIVLLKKCNGHLHLNRILHQESLEIPLKYVPVGHHLTYEVDGKVKEHLYLEGTPFKISEGTLILYQRKFKRLGSILEEHSRSDRWPF